MLTFNPTLERNAWEIQNNIWYRGRLKDALHLSPSSPFGLRLVWYDGKIWYQRVTVISPWSRLPLSRGESTAMGIIFVSRASTESPPPLLRRLFRLINDLFRPAPPASLLSPFTVPRSANPTRVNSRSRGEVARDEDDMCNGLGWLDVQINKAL